MGEKFGERLSKSLCEGCLEPCVGKQYVKVFPICQRLIREFKEIPKESDFFEYKGGFSKQPEWYKIMWHELELEYKKTSEEIGKQTKGK